MKVGTWKQLARTAESLAAEAVAAEEEILRHRHLLKPLGLPRVLRALLATDTPACPAAGRVMRFDFHWTTKGWQISEANSDVPGGFTEASHFTALMAEHFPSLRMAGHPAERWAETLALAAGTGGMVGLLSAPGYMEDHQVIAFLASHLRRRGCGACLARPEQLTWRGGYAHLNTRWHSGPVDLIVKFYQAEWLSRLPPKCGWKNLFREGKTPVANPGRTVISESKRFPLVWDELPVSVPTWRALLPETRDPRQICWSRDERWLLKRALCNTGDTVSIREIMPGRDWMRTLLSAKCFPGQWVAQQRFESVPVSTSLGLRHVCIGVYTINGQAAGAYARISEKALIDFAAVDVALLLEEDE